MNGRASQVIPIHPASGEDVDDPARRRFLHLMAASLALAGSACSGPPPEEIRPYVRMPEAVLPGQPTFYATTLVRRGYGLGVLVESNMGRPTKVEGNPAHPASRGATDVFAQAEVLQFWDPDRSQTPWQVGQITTWEAVRSFLAERGAALRPNSGAGLRVLTGAMTSPTWAAQWQGLLREFPAARWHCWEPLHDDGAFRAAGLAWNRPADTVLHLDKARVVASFGADFLGQAGEPGAVAYARDFAALRRQPERPSRLYAVDIAASLTGANADQRISLPPAEADRLVWRLAAALGVGEGAGSAPHAEAARWEAALARELNAHRGEGLLVAGPFLQPETRALVHLINHRLGNAGRTMDYLPPAELAPGSHADSLAALVKDMEAGLVDTLLILGCNPVYASPAGLGFPEALGRVAHSIHAGLYRDETGLACTWHLPLAHDFEHWSDVRAYEGSLSVVQPVIRLLYGARSAREILSMLGSGEPASDYEAVRRALAPLIPGGGGDFEAGWNRVLAEGVVAGSAPPPPPPPP
ncbi:MAG: molybdopterin oxidoreductase, partial [Actinomycetota bacterium]